MLRGFVRRAMSSAVTPTKTLTMATINPNLVKAEYAVRGRIPSMAPGIIQDRNKHPEKYAFKQVIFANIGNPQALAQKPITFFRQVLSLLDYDAMLSEENREAMLKVFAPDAIARALEYKAAGIKTGAYSDSQGIEIVRRQVADFISKRDGVVANPDNIFLSSGASDSVQSMLFTIIASPNVGIMIPIPQYPLYTATIALYNGLPVPYYLDESKEWSLTNAELEKSLKNGRASGADVRALAVINPGNPTGQCLSEETIREVIQFCSRNRLVLLADEVYQTNVYTEERPFVSFRKVLSTMEEKDSLELISFHTVSKGMIGECGRRGGYMELTNIDPLVREQLLKRASISLCPNIQGQIAVGLMVNPPKPGDYSYDQYKTEITDIYESLKRRALRLTTAFTSMPGISCNPSAGAMYAFPQVKLSARACAAAKAEEMEPDEFYCAQLLKEAGVVVVPGSGFRQVDGTFHFRTTFLPPESSFDSYISLFKDFHLRFQEKYA